MTVITKRKTKSSFIGLALFCIPGFISVPFLMVLHDTSTSGAAIVLHSGAPEPSSARSSTPLLDIGRKDGTHAIINIGSNLDPIVPNAKDDPCTVAFAFEPIVADQIPAHPGLHVISAAVSDEGGWSPMNLYNKDGRSSSLNKAAYRAFWNRKSTLKIVPIISFRTMLESLKHFELDLILTDMQGHDFAAVSSVGDLLKEVGVKRMVTEVNKDNIASYAGSKNDFCRDWLPHMTKIGYVFEGLTRMMGDTDTILEGYRNAEEVRATCEKDISENLEQKTGLNEYNAFWRLASEPAQRSGLEPYKYGTHSKKKSGFQFADQEYAKC